MLFSFQALPDFKAKEAKVHSEVETAGFFIIHRHTSNKDCTIFFFLAEFITPEMEVHVSFFYQKNTATCTAVQSRQFLPVSKTGYTFNLTCHSTISPLFQVNFEISPILL